MEKEADPLGFSLFLTIFEITNLKHGRYAALQTIDSEDDVFRTHLFHILRAGHFS